jgi:hypothetical protein
MAQTFTTHPKRIVLLVAGLFSAILGLFIVVLQPGNHRIIRLISLTCISLLVLAWCHFDSLERRQPLYPWLRGVILFLGLFALFVYLFKSRGLKQGLLSSGIALLSLSGLFVITQSSYFLFTVILIGIE